MKRLMPAIMIVASVLVAHPPHEEMSHGPAIMRLSEQERKETMEFIKEYGGGIRLKRLRNLRTNAPLDFERHLRRALIKKRDMERLRERDPRLYEKCLRIMRLERESFDLAEKYCSTENKQEREEIKKQLEAVLSEQFDLKVEEKNARIKRLEKEIARLKDELAKRKKSKKEIVANRLKDLLEEDKYLKW